MAVSQYIARARIAVADTTAADAAIFAMRLKFSPPTRPVTIDAITVCIDQVGAASAGQQGVYFDRFSKATHSGGTAVAICNALRDNRTSGVTDCRFHTGALTATGVVYDATPFAGVIIPFAVTNTANTYFFAPNLKLLAGDGLAMRLSEQAVVGLVVDVTVQWTEADECAT